MTPRDDGWRGLHRVFRLPGSRRRAEADVDAELHFHLDGRVEELMEREHLARDAAEREARRRFGDYDAYRREARDIDDRLVRGRHRMELLDTIAREVRQSARALRRAPAFSLIAFATLALGIGATTAIYTVLDSVVLRPLPYRDASRLVAVYHQAAVPSTGEAKWGLSSTGYFYFKNQNHTLADLGAYETDFATVTNGDRAEMVREGEVTASLFTTLQARTEIGRLFSAEDDRPHAAPVTVLSYEYWQRRFGGDRRVVGRLLETTDGSYQIIGIAEPGLTLPKPGAFSSASDLASFGVDVWMPLALDPALRANHHAYSGVGRLRPGVTAADAQRDLASLMTHFVELFPTVYSDDFMHHLNFRVAAVPLHDEVVGPVVRRSLWLLFGAVAVVLLVACANVANLFLVRMDARRRESALRTALGASRGQLAVHHLSESLMLTVAAGAAGVIVARAGLAAVLALAPTDIPRLADVGLSAGAILVAAGAAVVTGVVFGLLPAVGRDTDLATLRESGRGLTTSRARQFVRGGLVASQVALALVLLAAAGLALRSFVKLRRVHAGLTPHGVLTFSTALPGLEYRDPARVYAFQAELTRRLAALPGVTRAAAVDELPLRDMSGNGCTGASTQRQGTGRINGGCVHTPSMTPGALAALGIEVHGQQPVWSDIDPAAKTPGTAVVTQALANRFWPNENPIGQGISIGDAVQGYYRVVGVIPELRAQGLDQPPSEVVFWAGASRNETYVVRTSLADPLTLRARIQQIITSMNPRVPMTAVETMDDLVAGSMARATFLMTLLLLAGGMALLLSAVGIYGVISYVVAQRRAEIGIRMALGARGSQVAALVLGQSMRLVAVGVVIGMAGALAGTRLLRSLLFDVSPTDPAVLVATTVVLVTIAAAASVAPARRASRVDPVEAMRAG